jgi:hypothetical protein
MDGPLTSINEGDWAQRLQQTLAAGACETINAYTDDPLRPLDLTRCTPCSTATTSRSRPKPTTSDSPPRCSAALRATTAAATAGSAHRQQLDDHPVKLLGDGQPAHHARGAARQLTALAQPNDALNATAPWPCARRHDHDQSALGLLDSSASSTRCRARRATAREHAPSTNGGFRKFATLSSALTLPMHMRRQALKWGRRLPPWRQSPEPSL